MAFTISLLTYFGRLRVIDPQNKIGAKLISTYFQQNRFSSKQPKQYIVKEVDPNTGEEKKKKTKIVPKVTLLSGDDISVVTLDEAQSISKRRDLKLVKVQDRDTKTERPVYKLITGTEYHAEELKQREHRKKEKEDSFLKGEKVLLLNASISEHDVETRIKKISKWISKFLQVRVVINGDFEKGEKIYSMLEKGLKNEARFVQKRLKGNDMKFQIMPPKKSDTKKDL